MKFLLLTFIACLPFIAPAQTKEDSLLLNIEKLIIHNKPNEALQLLQTNFNNTTVSASKIKATALTVKAWKSKGNTAKEIEALQELIKLKDSFKDKEIKQAIAAIQLQHTIAQQQQALALQKITIQKQQIILAAFIVTGILVFLLVQQLHKKRYALHQLKQEQKLIQQKQEATLKILLAEEKERQRIAADLHDSLGQLLSAIKMNLSSIEENEGINNAPYNSILKKTLLLTDEGCKEVRNISYNLKPNALIEKGLLYALQMFIDKIDASKIKINLEATGLDKRLPAEVEIVLYRTIQEVVNNVLKHAKASVIDIALIKDEDGLSCTIEDNGIGFNKHIIQYGLGLKSIENRIKYLQGNVEWDSSPYKGTLVAIHIPMVDDSWLTAEVCDATTA